MEFFDCNTYIGSPAEGHLAAVSQASELLAAMDRAGISRALVWHVAQQDYNAVAGNELLTEAIAGEERLIGCWTLLPNQAGELGPTEAWFERMGQARVRALRAFPEAHRYLLRRETVGEILEVIIEKRVPLLLSPGRGASWQVIYDLLADFPSLVCIVCEVGSWPSDRWFRPLLARYPHVYVELSQYLHDGGIESVVRDYGAERLLFGSGFPDAYHGAMMLAIRHAEIGEDEREAIASGNVKRILAEVRL